MDMMESRRLKRENTVVNVWPPSPKAPARELSPKRERSSKKSKRTRSPSPSDDDSSEEERRRKERKERKRARKEKERKERKRPRSRSRKRYSEDEDSDDDRRRSDSRSRKRESRSKSRDLTLRSKSRNPTPPPDDDDDEEWVVKAPGASSVPSNGAQISLGTGGARSARVVDQGDSDDEEVGPKPLPKTKAEKRLDERSYGGALLRGEGSAMAAFLQDGTESRIPRRGEIGLTSDEIAKYEDVGYVMSGSRHRRMNAVRMRKENQVISAEEKRGILKLQKEERERREAILREEFSELVDERLKGTESTAKVLD